MTTDLSEKFELLYLVDHPEYIDTCGAWHYTAWGVKSDQRTLQKDIEKFRSSTKKDSVPFTILYRDRVKNVPVAMGSVWENGSDYWNNVTPWIVGMYVHENYRNLGLGKLVTAQLEQDAKYRGIDKIYLTASLAAGLYGKLGYDVVEVRDAPETGTGDETLFCKNLK